MSNKATAYTIIIYARAQEGSLSKLDEIPTGGLSGVGNGVGRVDPLVGDDLPILHAAGFALLSSWQGNNKTSDPARW